MPRFLLALVLCAPLAHAADVFTFANPPGPHAVGVRIVQQYDHTRLYKTTVDVVTGQPSRGERARPVQTLVWYPAARGGKPMTFRDYVATTPTEDDYTLAPAEVQRLAGARIDGNAGARRDVLLRDIVRPMQSVRDAAPAAGKFPVVIYAPSFSAVGVENTDLCEYLASQGYVVLASPSLGAHTRSMTLDLEGLEAQAADIAYLIGYARTLAQADANNVAVVGFSWGGLANVLAAAKDDRIRALVSLDGSLRGYGKFVDGGPNAAKYVSPARVAVPLLYVGRRPSTLEELNRSEVSTSFSFINQMKYSDVYVLSMMPMRHADFSSWALRQAQDEGFVDYTRDEVSAAYGWTARYVHRFLDAYLKHDAAGLAFLNATPRANGAPPHMIATDIRRNKGERPPTLETYAARLGAEGFDKAIPIYQQLSAGGAFTLSATEIFGWGVALAYRDMAAEAREIFRLGTHLNPDAGYMLDGLAEMQAKTGQREEAIRNYRRVLELDPKNTDALRYLKTQNAAP
jgi:dienelactone hydrolase